MRPPRRRLCGLRLSWLRPHHTFFRGTGEFTVSEITWCCDGGHMRISRGISVDPETNYLNATHKASQVRFGKPSALLPTHLVEERILRKCCNFVVTP